MNEQSHAAVLQWQPMNESAKAMTANKRIFMHPLNQISTSSATDQKDDIITGLREEIAQMWT